MKKLNKILIVVAALFTVSIATACNSAQTTNSNSESTAIVSDSTKPSDTKTSGKIIVDVRTIEEWNGDGHANCSVNIPLSDLSSKIEELKKYNEITLVCRSGNRANKAKAMLEEAGLKNITNLGAWENIQCK
jgi:rhodanese-related sulfurtransferase